MRYGFSTDLQHKLNNTLGHIAGHSELLHSRLQEIGSTEFLTDVDAIKTQLNIMKAELARDGADDLRRRLSEPVYVILSAATNIRRSIQAVHIDEILQDVHGIIFASSSILKLLNEENEEVVARGPAPPTAAAQPVADVPVRGEVRGRILLIDDDDDFRRIFFRLLSAEGYEVREVSGGQRGLDLLEAGISFDAVVLDLVLKDEDGFAVLETLRESGLMQETPILVISGLEDPESIVRSIRDGATDYLNKDLDPVIWKVRIDSAVERKRLLDAEREYLKAIIEYQARLKDELADAAEYVASLLPKPIRTGPVLTSWLFRPSADLGGDFFGYHWRNEQEFAFFMVDVSGHGIGSALHAAAVAHLLRAGTVGGFDTMDPASVLQRLNRQLPMEEHNEMFFTFFYGVYIPEQRRLVYAAGGGAPSFLVPPQGECRGLPSTGPVIGVDPEAGYANNSVSVDPGTILYLFSDGLFEVQDESGGIFGRRRLHDLLCARQTAEVNEIPGIVAHRTGRDSFDDDVTLLKLTFDSGGLPR